MKILILTILYGISFALLFSVDWKIAVGVGGVIIVYTLKDII